MEDGITTVNGVKLRPKTLEYLAEMQEDIPHYIDALIKLNDMLILKSVQYGETMISEEAEISHEMDFLNWLKYFRDFLETMKDD